ncbi:hypothetical protein M406DRAFT_70433 [Cryphonectria parasitica EP155]|uniref:Uncharacterized protein n=1 Tax=Cryphonectria parasitica (strain ATCC 38755 / EP155) TaxID=660469 RepID=A0A9P4Y138_CRYP1|nr:uncharacterized protein M406DRAFT_70433 [Cryphonectria parasitica EP155]KAF3765067.1 hypothetical protein M406DRAFT_70433 [Cryphonectria parasitica EP155]
MGNTPSKPSQGRTSQKLSKARIPNSSTAKAPTSAPSTPQAGTITLTSHDQAPALISIPYSATTTPSPVDEDHNEVGKEPSDRQFLVPPKVQRRLSLFRSKSSQDTSERRKSRRNTIIGPSTPTLEAGGVSRAQSLSAHNVTKEPQNVVPSSEDWSPTGNRASWAYDMSSYEAQRILNLVKDHNTHLPRSQTSTSLCESAHRAEMRSPIGRQTPAVIGQAESTVISRSNSEISLHPPMRRRSIIQTPGVATRTRPSPNVTRSRRSSLRHSHPPTPNMSRQPSFETDDSRFLSLPPLPVPIRVSEDAPRVLTPKDTDYSTTGAFKFGSLRITNGSPVSTPSTAAISRGPAEISRPYASGGVDYFASAPSRDTDMPSAAVEDLVQSSTVPQEPLFSKSGSVRDVVPQAQLPPLSITTASHGTDASDILSPASQTSPVVEIQQKAPASPVLKTQSRQAAVDDDLFEDDDQPEISGVEVLDIRLDPNAKSLPPQPVDWSQQGTQGIARSDSGFESNAKSESSQSCNSLTKADSGYSSNMSLRSLRNEKIQSTLEREAERSSTESERDSSLVLGREPRRSLETQVTKPMGALEVSAANSAHSDKAPTPPPKDDVSLKPTSQPSKQTAGPGVTPRKVARPQPAAIDTNKGKDKRGLRSPGSAPSTPASVRSEDSTSSLSIGNNTQKPGRLQRFLSLNHSARQSLTVHETHTFDNEVPSVPKEVEDKLREHTGLFPTTARRLALKSQISKETLKTILSVGSLEISKDNELPATPTTPDGDDDKTIRDSDDSQESSLKQAFSSVQTNFKSGAVSVVQHRRDIPRKPVPTPRPSQDQGLTQQALRDDSMLALTTRQAEILTSNQHGIAQLVSLASAAVTIEPAGTGGYAKYEPQWCDWQHEKPISAGRYEPWKFPASADDPSNTPPVYHHLGHLGSLTQLSRCPRLCVGQQSPPFDVASPL